MKTYKDELIKSMTYLAEKPNTIFVTSESKTNKTLQFVSTSNGRPT